MEDKNLKYIGQIGRMVGLGLTVVGTAGSLIYPQIESFKDLSSSGLIIVLFGYSFLQGAESLAQKKVISKLEDRVSELESKE